MYLKICDREASDRESRSTNSVAVEHSIRQTSDRAISDRDTTGRAISNRVTTDRDARDRWTRSTDPVDGE
jgi:hypothetical protein